MEPAPATEIETYERLLCSHLDRMVARLREWPADRWVWAPAPPAPCARQLAEHALQWLQCDRQHILNADPASHARIPEPPRDPKGLCDALAQETDEWRALIRTMTEERLAEPRSQFDSPTLSVRWFIYHMIQNTIYKHGQLATLYFALGLDGDDPYAAPLPNPIYEECFG